MSLINSKIIDVRLMETIPKITKILSQIDKLLEMTKNKTIYYISINLPNKTIALQLTTSAEAAAKLLSLINKDIPVNIFLKYIVESTTSKAITNIADYPQISYEKLSANHQKITLFYIKTNKGTKLFFIREFNNGKSLFNKILSDIS